MAKYEIRNQFGDPFEPLPTQMAFLLSKAERTAYVGVLGAGKTLAGSVKALMKAIEEPGWRPGRTAIARQTYPQLIKTTWDTFRKVVINSCPDLIANEKRSTHEVSMTLKNGWEFLGTNLAHFQDFGSLDLDNFWIDEMNDDGVTLDSWNMLSGRLGRARIGDGIGWGTGNPGGKNWSYNLFYRVQFEGGAGIKGYQGFLPGPKENIHVPKDYLDKLRLTYPDEWIAKLLEGSFDVFEGQVYDELSEELHRIDPFPIPEEWPRYFGLDHGLTNPTAGVWVAVDFDGNHYVYRTYYKRNSIPADNAKAILGLEGPEADWLQWRVIDRATRQHQTAGGVISSIKDQYAEAGLYCREGDSSAGAVKAGIAIKKQLLQCDEAHVFPAWHPRAGDYGAPRLYIFKSEREYWSEAMQYRWKAVSPSGIDKEVPLAVHNHLLDAHRYIELMLPRTPAPAPRDPLGWLKAALDEQHASRELDLEFIGS
jgi:hypothetical protein